MGKRDRHSSDSRRTKHPELLLAAMVITILIITGFQAYWIRDNYRREKNVTEVKAFSLFRETVRSVQDSIVQVKLHSLMKDTASQDAINRGMENRTIGRRKPALPGTVRVLNILTERNEQTKPEYEQEAESRNIIISLRESDTNVSSGIERVRSMGDRSSIEHIREGRFVEVERESPRPANHSDLSSQCLQQKDTPARMRSRINTFFIEGEERGGVRISIDSLFRDTIPLKSLDSIFAKTLQSQQLPLPFNVKYNRRLSVPDGSLVVRPLQPNSFAGYSLVLGNMFPYLLRQITLPVVFSLFLVALTVASFVLLYRNILRQQKLAQLKNDLVSNITHELKTPIATVNVAIEALRDFNALKDEEKTKEYLSISRNELQRLELLVDKVLKLSMFESRQIHLNEEQVDIEALIREVIASMKLQVEKQNGRIHFQSPGAVTIRGDKLHLLSVVFSLLDNAVKYSGDKVDIQVRLEQTENSILLHIADRGIGIPRQYQDKIFDKFFRVPAGDIHNAKGHGLGLSYAAEVIRQHNGSIQVESEEGKGSTLIITLPRTTQKK